MPLCDLTESDLHEAMLAALQSNDASDFELLREEWWRRFPTRPAPDKQITQLQRNYLNTLDAWVRDPSPTNHSMLHNNYIAMLREAKRRSGTGVLDAAISGEPTASSAGGKNIRPRGCIDIG